MPSIFPANTTTKAEGSGSAAAAPPQIQMIKGLNPMQFPKEGVIPVTEKAIRAQGVTFCVHKIQDQNRCLDKAREAYLGEGLDPTKGPEWYQFHLKMCLETHKTATHCVMEHREKERRKRIREKRLSSVANFGC